MPGDGLAAGDGETARAQMQRRQEGGDDRREQTQRAGEGRHTLGLRTRCTIRIGPFGRKEGAYLLAKTLVFGTPAEIHG